MVPLLGVIGSEVVVFTLVVAMVGGLVGGVWRSVGDTVGSRVSIVGKGVGKADGVIVGNPLGGIVVFAGVTLVSVYLCISCTYIMIY